MDKSKSLTFNVNFELPPSIVSEFFSGLEKVEKAKVPIKQRPLIDTNILSNALTGMAFIGLSSVLPLITKCCPRKTEEHLDNLCNGDGDCNYCRIEKEESEAAESAEAVKAAAEINEKAEVKQKKEVKQKEEEFNNDHKSFTSETLLNEILTTTAPVLLDNGFKILKDNFLKK